jgi:hypothetical protein
METRNNLGKRGNDRGLFIKGQATFANEANIMRNLRSDMDSNISYIFTNTSGQMIYQMIGKVPINRFF